MPGVADLDGLTLTAVRRAPEGPFVAAADHVHRAPEARADGRVRRVLEQPGSFAALDLPPDLAAELEVQPLVVDGPRPVGVHEDPVIGGGHHLLERAVARKQADVRHAHHRDAVKAVRSYGRARTLDARKSRRVAAAER